MKKLITICLALMLSSSLYAFEYEIKPGWQQLGAVSDINDPTIFNGDGSCVEYLWQYDNADVEAPIWRLHVANGVDYSYTGPAIEKINKGQGFWAKAVGECTVTLNTPDGPPAPPPIDGSGNNTTSIVSCKDILDSGKSTGDGMYSIDPDKSGEMLNVFCDMTTDGGGWTLVSTLNKDINSSILTTEAVGGDVDSSNKISKLADIKINTLVQASKNINPYKLIVGPPESTPQIKYFRKTCEFKGDTLASGDCIGAAYSQDSTSYTGSEVAGGYVLTASFNFDNPEKILYWYFSPANNCLGTTDSTMHDNIGKLFIR